VNAFPFQNKLVVEASATITNIGFLGDINKDGYNDFGVVCDNCQFSIYIFYGGPNLVNITDFTIQYDVVLQNGLNSEGTNWLHSIGDVNNDGYGDIFSSAYPNSGVFYGGGSLSSSYDLQSLANPNGSRIVYGAWQSSAHLDFNMDGNEDLVIGDTTPNSAVILLGDGSKYPSLVTVKDLPLSSCLRFQGRTNQQFGYWVAAAGDVNQDGFPDVLFGAKKYPPSGAAILWYGSSVPSSNLTMANFTPKDGVLFYYSDNSIVNFGLGAVVTGAGDFNGDGYPDIAIGASGGLAVFLVYGSKDLSPTIDLAYSTSWKGVKIVSDNNGIGGDRSIAGGDINGDGFSDLVVSELTHNSLRGRVSIVWGGPNVSSIIDLRQPSDEFYSLQGADIANPGDTNFGNNILLGDVNGDNALDILTITYQRAYILFNSPPSPTPSISSSSSPSTSFSPTSSISVSNSPTPSVTPSSIPEYYDMFVLAAVQSPICLNIFSLHMQ